jgi:hypothetical protein
MSLKTEVQILGDASSLAKATKRASGDLDKFGKKTKGMGSHLKGVFAGIAAGFAISQITDFAKSSVKAAIADNTAQVILASTLKKTTGATATQVAGVEKLISTYQMQTGILDDELRPAFQSLATSTHSVGKSNELLQIAMDASTATGKPLNQVALAIGKAFNGSNTSLIKLMPSLKKSKTPIEDLAKAFKGAALEAANQNPFKIFDTTMADVSESVGRKLLPKLQEFADYLKSPEGQQAITTWTNLLVGMAKAATDIVTALTKLPNGMQGFMQNSALTNLTNMATVPFGAKPISDVANRNTANNYEIMQRQNRYFMGGKQGMGGNFTQNVTVNVSNSGRKDLKPEDVATAVKRGIGLYGKGYGK